MKKISALILAAVLACSAAHAQNQKTTSDSAAVTGPQTVTTVVTDSVAISESSADVDYLADGQPAETPYVEVKDGKWSLSYDGSEYVISDLLDDSSFADKFRGLEDLDAETLILKDNMGLATTIIAIIFGFPCLTIIVGLLVILMFALKRNRGRNELINNAIEHDYQLPDSFYLGQKSVNGSPTAPVRDSRKFYTATTLIAVGISLIIFALWVDAPFFIVAGGIPLLMGIGQLIGYYCVPTTPKYPGNRPYPGPQPMCGQYPNGAPAPWEPSPGQFPGAPGQPYGQSPVAPMMTPASPLSSQVPPCQPATPCDSMEEPSCPSQPESAPLCEPCGQQTPPPYNPS